MIKTKRNKKNKTHIKRVIKVNIFNKNKYVFYNYNVVYVID